MRQHIKTNVAFIVAPVIMLTATVTFAEESGQPNYTYLELDYVYGEASGDGRISDAESYSTDFHLSAGYALKGSMLAAEKIVLRASYYDTDDEWKSTADIDITSTVLGASWLVNNQDGYGIDAGIEYRKDEIDFNPGIDFSSDIEGFGLGFGLRAVTSANTELGLRATWYQGDWSGTVGVIMNFAWHINDQWGINASWDYIDADPDVNNLNSAELNQYALGARYYF